MRILRLSEFKRVVQTAPLVNGAAGILIQVSLILEPMCSAHCTDSRNLGGNTGITSRGEKQQYPRAFPSQMQYQHQVLECGAGGSGEGVILW